MWGTLPRIIPERPGTGAAASGRPGSSALLPSHCINGWKKERQDLLQTTISLSSVAWDP